MAGPLNATSFLLPENPGQDVAIRLPHQPKPAWVLEEPEPEVWIDNDMEVQVVYRDNVRDEEHVFAEQRERPAAAVIAGVDANIGVISAVVVLQQLLLDLIHVVNWRRESVSGGREERPRRDLGRLT